MKGGERNVDVFIEGREDLDTGVGERTTYLESLLARFIRRLINDLVVLRPWEMFVLKRVKCTLHTNNQNQPSLPERGSLQETPPTHPFTINRHLRIVLDPQRLALFNIAHLLHIRSVTSRSEDDSDLRAWVDVVRGDERAGRVVDEGGECYWDILGNQLSAAGTKEWEGKARTALPRDSMNMAATSRPSVFVTPKPLVQRMS